MLESILTQGTVFETALWPQGDIRDPLGVWGSRLGVTGDATGGIITTTVRVAADKASAYVYTVYSANISKLTGASLAGVQGGIRLLTNWPNVDAQAGVQAYGSFKTFLFETFGGAGAPFAGANQPLIDPQDRFLLLWTPLAGATDIDIIEMKIDQNEDLATYSFESYGYFWDRSVMQAPGGLRHPGSN